MKRRTYLVIAFALSFLIIFAISFVGEIKAQIPMPTSKSAELEVVKIPRDTNKADSLPQVKAKVPVIDKPIFGGGCVWCPQGSAGHWTKSISGELYCILDCN